MTRFYYASNKGEEPQEAEKKILEVATLEVSAFQM
jgi:hypothetical protein